MDETAAPDSRRSWGALIVVLLPVIYFLSVGPAVLIHDRLNSASMKNAIESFYFPLEMLYRYAPLLQGPMDFYLELWR